MQPAAQPSQKPAQALYRLAAQWANSAAAFFYPEWCQLCDRRRATPAEGFVCADCRSQVRWLSPPLCQRCGLPFQGDLTQPFECANCRELDFAFSFARSAVVARNPVLDAIHRYKYNRALWLEPFLAELLVQKAVPELSGQDWNLLVPVPLYPARERHREFNQAERLACHLGKALSLPVNAGALRRITPTPTQTHLSREARAANVRNAFALSPDQDVEGSRIVLVDDVFTTGATTSACARTLLRGGAAEVCVWTLARGI